MERMSAPYSAVLLGTYILYEASFSARDEVR